MEELVLENEYEIAVPLFGAFAAVLSSTENRRIQGLFKAFVHFPVLIKAYLIFKDFSKQEGQEDLNRSPEFCLKLT